MAAGKVFSRAQRDRENDKQLTDRKYFDPQLGLDEKWNGRILTGLFFFSECLPKLLQSSETIRETKAEKSVGKK